MQRHPHDVSEVFVHYPLPIHRFSHQAAQAVECATRQGRFAEMRDRLFAQQDSFGLKPWAAYAAAAGVPDTVRFASCLKDSTAAARIVRGSKLAEQLALSGTPTIMVNGWLYPLHPTLSELEADAKRIASGKEASAAQ